MKGPRLFSDMIVVALLIFVLAVDVDFLGCALFAILFTPTMYMVYGALAILILMRFLHRTFELKRIAVIILFSLAMVILYFTPLTSRKPFLRDLNRVHLSMTIPEVEAIMGKYIKDY